MSYEAFWPNDRHIVNYYDNQIPYHVLDKNQKPDTRVDVISSVCPCAGLSQLSHGFGDHNQNNRWMIESAKFVLSEMKPKVFWGENAPGLSGKIGKNVREQLYKIGRENGYSMSLYRTKSLLHGLSQIRERSFYFFWEGDKVPELNYFNREHEKIEDTILNAKGNTLNEPINKKTPSVDDPYYRYILEDIHGGISHREFCQIVEPANARGNDTYSYIEKVGRTYTEVAEWMKAHGYDKEVDKCMYRVKKLGEGGNIMRRGTIVPRDYIGAFVGHYPTMLTHPVEDRYITYREALTIMGLPDRFELLDYKNTVNHVCQNVPVRTAYDMANEVKNALEGNRSWVNATMAFQYNHSKTIEVASVESGNLAEFFA
jgi:site-specific DNA-cytosine methylase